MTTNRSTKYCCKPKIKGNMALVLLLRRKPEKRFLKKKQKKKNLERKYHSSVPFIAYQVIFYIMKLSNC